MTSRATRDPLVGASRATFAEEWLRRRAVEADGDGEWLPVASARRVLEVIDAARGRQSNWTFGHRHVDLWMTLASGLLRDFVGLSITETASRLGMPRATAAHRARLHRNLVSSSPEYADRATELADRAVWEPAPPVSG